MGKRVSPVFAVIVIIIALIVGGLYFMVRYRNAEAQFAAESAALQRQADEARASGRMARGRPARGDRSRMGSRMPEPSERQGPGAPGAPAEGR